MTIDPAFWTVAGGAVLMVGLRCAPILIPPGFINRYGSLLSSLSRVAIGLALISSMYRLFRVDASEMAKGLLFAGTGFAVFAVLRSLSAAILCASALFLAVRLVV